MFCLEGRTQGTESSKFGPAKVREVWNFQVRSNTSTHSKYLPNTNTMHTNTILNYVSKTDHYLDVAASIILRRITNIPSVNSKLKSIFFSIAFLKVIVMDAFASTDTIDFNLSHGQGHTKT